MRLVCIRWWLVTCTPCLSSDSGVEKFETCHSRLPFADIQPLLAFIWFSYKNYTLYFIFRYTNSVPYEMNFVAF